MRASLAVLTGRLFSRVSIYGVAWAAVSPALAYIIRHGGYLQPLAQSSETKSYKIVLMVGADRHEIEIAQGTDK